MNCHQARIQAISQRPDGAPLSRISCPPRAIPAAGQPVLGYKIGTGALRRFTLYPSDILEDGFRCPTPDNQHWRPGDQLDLLGPIGRGFSPPADSRRWLLMSAAVRFDPLLPLLASAEDNGLSVVLISDQPVLNLPESVEVLTEPETGLEWADFAAICLPLAELDGFRNRLGRYRDLPLPCPAQVLVQDQLPCGFGGCLCCGLATTNGWSLRCQDGPVFSWEELNV